MNDIENQIPPSWEEQNEAQERQDLEDEQQEREHIKNQNKNKMQTVGKFTSKVTNVQSNGTYDSKYGLMYKYEIGFEDGHVGEYSSSKYTSSNQEGFPFTMDTMAEFEFSMYNDQYPKVKQVQKEQGNFSQSNKSYSKPSEESKYPSFSLSYAKDSICAHGLPTGTEPTPDNIADIIHALADKHLEWLNEKSK